jgi:acetyl-CoA acetyltransferase
MAAAFVGLHAPQPLALGAATICIGMGQGVATVLERVN